MDGNRIDTEVKPGEAWIERHEEGFVDVAIVLDATASRQDSIDKVKRDFRKQMDRLSSVATDKLRLSIFSYGGGGQGYISEPSFHGTFENFHEAAQAVDQIRCRAGLTGIYNTLGALSQMQSRREIPQLEAIILYGDTVDELEDNVNLNHITRYAHNLKVPIVTFLEITRGESGTELQRDEPAMRAISEATGVKNCPIRYEFNNPQVNFADFVRVIAAAAEGPEVVEALKKSGDIPDEVWESLPEKTIETVSEPEPVMPVVEPEPEEKRWSSTFWGIVSGGSYVVPAVALLWLLANDANNVPTEPVEPEIVTPDDLRESFDRTGEFIFDAERYQEAFPTGAAEVTPEFAENLNVLGQFLQDNPQYCNGLTITGHTDPRGGSQYNMGLSERRADSVGTYLVSNFDIAAPIETIGRGEEELLFPGQSGADIYAKERRIGFVCERNVPN